MALSTWIAYHDADIAWRCQVKSNAAERPELVSHGDRFACIMLQQSSPNGSRYIDYIDYNTLFSAEDLNTRLKREPTHLTRPITFRAGSMAHILSTTGCYSIDEAAHTTPTCLHS